MKKIFLYFCFLIIFGCAGFEPIFSTKDLTFYIDEIENIKNNKNTKQIVRNILSYKLNNATKNNYSLKINSETRNEVTSRDSKGDPLTYRVIISTGVKVFKGNSNNLFNNINIIVPRPIEIENYLINKGYIGTISSKKNFITIS